MDDELALYMMLSMAKILHFHLGWDGAQRDLCRVGEEFVDDVVGREARPPYNDTDAILREVAEALIKKHEVTSAISVETASELPVARAALRPPYRIRVEGCIFRELHNLFKKYGFRRNWRRDLTKYDGMLLVCPVMNLMVHAIEVNSDYLAGHCLEASELGEKSCTCLIDVFSRELDAKSLEE